MKGSVDIRSSGAVLVMLFRHRWRLVTIVTNVYSYDGKTNYCIYVNVILSNAIKISKIHKEYFYRVNIIFIVKKGGGITLHFN